MTTSLIPFQALAVVFQGTELFQIISEAASSSPALLDDTTVDITDMEDEEEPEAAQKFRLGADTLRGSWRPTAKREYEESQGWLSDVSLYPWVHRLPSGTLFSIQKKGGGVGVYTDEEETARGQEGEKDDDVDGAPIATTTHASKSKPAIVQEGEEVEHLVWDDEKADRIHKTLKESGEGDGEDVVYKDYDRSPLPQSHCVVNYKVYLRSGQMIEQTTSPVGVRPGELIQAVQEVIQLMRIGDKWTLWAPPHSAFGEHGAGAAIPPNAAIKLELELLDMTDDSPSRPAHEASDRLKGLIGQSFDEVKTESEVMADPSYSQYILMLRNYGQDTSVSEPIPEDDDDYDPAKDEEGNPIPDAWADTRGKDTERFKEQAEQKEDKHEDPWALPFTALSASSGTHLASHYSAPTGNHQMRSHRSVSRSSLVIHPLSQFSDSFSSNPHHVRIGIESRSHQQLLALSLLIVPLVSTALIVAASSFFRRGKKETKNRRHRHQTTVR